MKDFAHFEAVGTLKSYRLIISATSTFAFLNVLVNKSTYINATAFAPALDELSEDDEGQQVRIKGVIKSYKNKTTQEWTLGYTVKEIEVLESESTESSSSQQSTDSDINVTDEDLPW